MTLGHTIKLVEDHMHTVMEGPLICMSFDVIWYERHTLTGTSFASLAKANKDMIAFYICGSRLT